MSSGPVSSGSEEKTQSTQDDSKTNDSGVSPLGAARTRLIKECMGQDVTEEAHEEYKEVVERNPSGGMKFADAGMQQMQSVVIWQFIQSMGLNLIQGQNLTKISLPVELFEPKSFLQRLTQPFADAPRFLTASAELSPLEQMKNVIAFVVIGFHRTMTQWKPFNPILGETYQAEIDDGTKIFCEQTSHHPPITHFQVLGPDIDGTPAFDYIGYANWQISWRGGSISARQEGPHVVTFKNGTRITWTLPEFWLSGLLWGDRVADFSGEIPFRSNKKLECKLTFDPDALGYLSSFVFSSVSPSDTFRGTIKQKVDKTTTKDLCTVEGSWVSHINMDNKKFCVWKDTPPSVVSPAPNPLPSDSRFRKDMLTLKTGDFVKAQAAKEELENIQRRDRKLREKYKAETAET